MRRSAAVCLAVDPVGLQKQSTYFFYFTNDLWLRTNIGLQRTATFHFGLFREEKAEHIQSESRDVINLDRAPEQNCFKRKPTELVLNVGSFPVFLQRCRGTLSRWEFLTAASEDF